MFRHTKEDWPPRKNTIWTLDQIPKRHGKNDHHRIVDSVVEIGLRQANDESNQSIPADTSASQGGSKHKISPQTCETNGEIRQTEKKEKNKNMIITYVYI